ncbi:hypothetical protein ES702_03949 [subsurface metagenome]
MNKAQAKIAWWVVILLSLTSLVYGLYLWWYSYDFSFEVMLITFFIIPLLLIGGLAFIRAKDKDKET